MNSPRESTRFLLPAAVTLHLRHVLAARTTRILLDKNPKMKNNLRPRLTERLLHKKDSIEGRQHKLFTENRQTLFYKHALK